VIPEKLKDRKVTLVINSAYNTCQILKIIPAMQRRAFNFKRLNMNCLNFNTTELLMLMSATENLELKHCQFNHTNCNMLWPELKTVYLKLTLSCMRFRAEDAPLLAHI
jgi:hypothetical protein